MFPSVNNKFQHFTVYVCFHSYIKHIVTLVVSKLTHTHTKYQTLTHTCMNCSIFTWLRAAATSNQWMELMRSLSAVLRCPAVPWCFCLRYLGGHKMSASRLMVFVWKIQDVDILLMAEILHPLRLVVFPIIYRVSYISSG